MFQCRYKHGLLQVLAKAYEGVTAMVSQAASTSKKDAFTALGGVVDKMSDVKLRTAACGLLDALAEAVGPQFVCAQLHKKAAAHKSPKVCYRLRLEAGVGRLHAPRPQGALHAVFVRADAREPGRRLEPKLCKAPPGLPWLMVTRPLCVYPAAQQICSWEGFLRCAAILP